MIEKTEEIKLERQQQQMFAAKISIFASILLFLVTAVVGIMIDSITLLLDASSSLVILLVAFLMHFSIKKLHRPADELYNFGYGKYEPMTISLQGVLIIATCLMSIKFAIQDIIHAESVSTYGLPAITTFFSGILGVFIVLYLRKVARKTNSSMLKTSSFHWYVDTILSFGVCAGFLFGFFLQESGFIKITPYIDPVMAIILALFLMWVPVKIVIRNVLELLDIVPEKEIREKVRKVVEKYTPNSFGVHRLRSRKAGEKIFVDVCFIVKANLTVSEVEELAKNFEMDLKRHLSACDVIVYFKPA